MTEVLSAAAAPHTGRWLADTPADWVNPPHMSDLHAILLFVGGPALLFVVISLLVIAPSIAKGPRYRPGQAWYAESQWFGAPDRTGASDDELSEVDAGASRGQTDAVPVQPSDEGVGGASARW